MLCERLLSGARVKYASVLNELSIIREWGHTEMRVAPGLANSPEEVFADIENDSARRLLVVALDEFAARGFHSTTTRDVSTKSGLSAAAMYVHYPSKEAMLFQIALVGHSAARDRLRNALAEVDQTAGSTERLEVILREFTCWHAEHTTVARVCEYELQHLNVEHRAQIDKIRREIEVGVRDEVQRGVKSGEFSVPDVRYATMALTSLAIDIVRWYTPGTGVTPAELADNLAVLGLKMVTV